jgi:hypothetical protein
MDRAIHATAARQRRIGGIHNRAGGHARDIAFLQNHLPPGCADPLHTYLLQSFYDQA